ncbi:hypothetical protein CW304_20890 [Bacillus sp. UFRGS-B20]|nr:hypothetical protein CW304_20890 [Bacillus sp. UFRGS-B20]
MLLLAHCASCKKLSITGEVVNQYYVITNFTLKTITFFMPAIRVTWLCFKVIMHLEIVKTLLYKYIFTFLWIYTAADRLHPRDVLRYTTCLME